MSRKSRTRNEREQRRNEVCAVAGIILLLILGAECWRTLLWALSVSAR